jgi:hypothetical protein
MKRRVFLIGSTAELASELFSMEEVASKNQANTEPALINALVMCKNTGFEPREMTYKRPLTGAPTSAELFWYNEQAKKLRFSYKSDKPLGEITPEKLASFDMVMISTQSDGWWNMPYSEREREAVKSYVSNGGFIFIIHDWTPASYGCNYGQFMHEFGFTPLIYPENYPGEPTGYGWNTLYFAGPGSQNIRFKVRNNATPFTEGVNEAFIVDMKPVFIINPEIAKPMIIPAEHVPVRTLWSYGGRYILSDFEHSLSRPAYLSAIQIQYGSGNGCYITGLNADDPSNKTFFDNVLKWIYDKTKMRRAR